MISEFYTPVVIETIFVVFARFSSFDSRLRQGTSCCQNLALKSTNLFESQGLNSFSCAALKIAISDISYRLESSRRNLHFWSL